MASLTIEIHGDSREFVDKQVNSQLFDSADDFIEFLIQGEIARSHRESIEKSCLDALHSEPVPLTDAFFDNMSARVEAGSKKECST